MSAYEQSPDQKRAFEVMRQWPDPECSALVSWAVRDVESLHYLADLDSHVIEGRNALGHSLPTVDNAHPKWAATTAMSTVDRCAAALARADRLPKRSNREYSIQEIERNPPKKRLLQEASSDWIDSVLHHRRYAQLKSVRDPIVHGRHARVVQLSTRDEWSTQRDIIRLEGSEPPEIEVGDVVVRARDFATDHIESVLTLIADGAINYAPASDAPTDAE